MTHVAVRPVELAGKLLAEHTDGQIPVPVEPLLAALGWEVGRNHFDGPQAGFTAGVDGLRIIGVNTSTSPRRQRLSLAHSLGHGLLHTARKLTVCHSIRPGDADPSMPSDVEEAQAREFAMSLLMPADTVRRSLRGELDDATHASRDALIARLARTFQVSNEAMGYRLISLNLIAG